MVRTFIVEWDVDSLYSLILAEDTLRSKADELKDLMYELAAETEEKNNESK